MMRYIYFTAMMIGSCFMISADLGGLAVLLFAGILFLEEAIYNLEI